MATSTILQQAVALPDTMTPEDQLKELLEKHPLYKRIEIMLPVSRNAWPKPTIVADCPVCGSQQTHTMTSDYQQYDQELSFTHPGGQSSPRQLSLGLKVVYLCAGCGKMRRYFLLTVLQHRAFTPPGIPPLAEAPTTITKVGQTPAWDIDPDPQLAKKLGKQVGLFKKGLICESQSFGIGAFAYYRRIVEEVIGELLADISELVNPEEQAQYAEALREAEKSHRAADKIEHVKNLVPAILRPGGANPLGTLHGAISEGLHALTEEECLERAADIRDALQFLVSQIRQAKESATRFGKQLQNIADRRRPPSVEDTEKPSDGQSNKDPQAGN